MSALNLIIQTQRLGDLIMTYPLCDWLNSLDNKAIWLVAEERFFKDMMRLSPKNICYVPLAAAFGVDGELNAELLKREFNTLINLSHGMSAANLTSKIKAKNKFGAYKEKDDTRVNGFWQIYRMSLTHNNHYNKFHWVELNALDIIPLERIKQTEWKKANFLNKGRIGLFVGASEKAKRPDAQFWAELALALANKGYQPVFLGGNKEEECIAQKAATLAKMPRASLAGRFTLLELSTFLQTLDLLVTPDTGPMHLAAAQGVATFNLSLGPVHPWETAPYQPDHYVLRSSISCSGCWQCTKSSQLCKKPFIPSRIANLLHNLLQNKSLPNLPELLLYKTARTEDGFYQLENVCGSKHYHDLQGNFWRYFFANHFYEQNIFLQQNPTDIESKQNSIRFTERMQRTNQELLETLPKLHKLLRKNHALLIKEMMRVNKSKSVLEHDAWKKYPPFMRPLASFIQLFLENGDYDLLTREKIMILLEDFAKQSSM